MLEKFKSTVNRGIATVSVKSEAKVEMSRIKAQLQNLQSQRAVLIKQLGDEMYAMWTAGEMNREQFEQTCGQIHAYDGSIAEQNRRMEQVRLEEAQLLGTKPAVAPVSAMPQPASQAGGQFCSSCGAKNVKESRFCVACGNQLEK